MMQIDFFFLLSLKKTCLLFFINHPLQLICVTGIILVTQYGHLDFFDDVTSIKYYYCFFKRRLYCICITMEPFTERFYKQKLYNVQEIVVMWHIYLNDICPWASKSTKETTKPRSHLLSEPDQTCNMLIKSVLRLSLLSFYVFLFLPSPLNNLFCIQWMFVLWTKAPL